MFSYLHRSLLLLSLLLLLLFHWTCFLTYCVCFGNCFVSFLGMGFLFFSSFFIFFQHIAHFFIFFFPFVFCKFWWCLWYHIVEIVVRGLDNIHIHVFCDSIG